MAEASAPLLELRDVTVVRGERVALDHVSLTLPVGEHVTILGPNGSGKSTLVKLINRELYPLAGQGEMRILGRSRWDVSELRSTLGVVTNDLQYGLEPEMLVVEAVLAGVTGKLGYFWSEVTPGERLSALEVLRSVEAEELAERQLGTLSSGEARRVLIARALAHGPQTLLLDEPTTSLDLVSADRLMTTLRQLARAGKSLVLVTHHLEEIVPEIDRVILLKRGRVLADGAPSAVLTSETLSELFEHKVSLVSQDPYRVQVCR